MISSTKVYTLDAETATGLLFRTLGLYKVTALALRTTTNTRRLPRLREPPQQVQAQATLVRLLSITESFTSGTLVRHTEPLFLPAGHPVIKAVYGDAEEKAVFQWENMRNAYRNWLGVQWDESLWKPVKVLTDARNAIAHGLGSLTRRQTRRSGGAAIRTSLMAAGVTLDGDKLVLDDAFLSKAAKTCRNFIQDVDLRVQERPYDRR
jgi:hypothetical protein